eukprot:scaffold42456_cov66-Phaeocystis_antarctica.AAC.3
MPCRRNCEGTMRRRTPLRQLLEPRAPACWPKSLEAFASRSWPRRRAADLTKTESRDRPCPISQCQGSRAVRLTQAGSFSLRRLDGVGGSNTICRRSSTAAARPRTALSRSPPTPWQSRRTKSNGVFSVQRVRCRLSTYDAAASTATSCRLSTVARWPWIITVEALLLESTSRSKPPKASNPLPLSMACERVWCGARASGVAMNGG